MSAMPDDWTLVTIENCCEILDRYRVPVNSEEREGRIGEIPYYGANGLQGFIDSHIFDEPLILIAEDGGRFEEYATRPIAYRVSGKSWVNNHAHVLRAKCDFDQDAIFYALEHKDIQHFIVGGTRAKLNQGALKAIQIQLADSKHEQSKIAEILSTVDQAIEQTEALIAKQQRIKTGLMQDLLTRGIDEHGQLRTEQTHAFKDSPLGRIPVEWEITAVANVINGIDAGWSPSCEDVTPGQGEWGVLKVSAISAGVFNPKESKRLPGGLLPLPELEVQRGDVLLSRANGVTELVGRCVYVEETPSQLMLSDKTLRLRPCPEKVIAQMLCEQLKAESSRRQILNYISGSSGQKNLSQKQIGSILLALAPVQEQQIICDLVANASKQFESDVVNLVKTQSLKRALMQDLLTGRKRVTDLLEPTAA